MRCERLEIAPATRWGEVVARAEALADAGAGELVLARPGAAAAEVGEVALRLRRRGARVVVESSGEGLDASVARVWKQGGVALVRIWPVDWAEGVPGLGAALAAGLAVEVGVSVTRSSLRALTTLPGRAVQTGLGRAQALVVRVPVTASAGELVAYMEAAEAIVALDRAARLVGIPLRLAPDSGPPPCVFPAPSAVAHLYSLTAGGATRPGYVKLEPCARCVLADRCPGIRREALALGGTPPMRPVVDERVRRRLSVISSVQEQMAREFIQPSRYHDPLHGDLDEEIIRVNFHCNQACRFCFVSTHLPPYAEDRVRDAILSAAARGKRIALSGGEPTLNPRIVEYVRLAKERSRLPVQLQTNAVQLADRSLAESLAAAGLDEAFVSLHASNAELSDAITGAPGTFAHTVQGIDHLHATAVRVLLNFVICQANAHDMPAYARLVASRWPRATVVFSFVSMSTDLVPRDRTMVPRYTEVLPFLEEALRILDRAHVATTGFESMCGLPLCLVPGGVARLRHMVENLPPDGGEFIKTDTCRACALATRCYGLRTSYAQMYGTDELRAVRDIGAPA